MSGRDVPTQLDRLIDKARGQATEPIFKFDVSFSNVGRDFDAAQLGKFGQIALAAVFGGAGVDAAVAELKRGVGIGVATGNALVI
jgi:hypothetical protein